MPALAELMRRLLIASLLVPFAPDLAEASGCFVGPYVQTYDNPIDCPFVVYRRTETGGLPPPEVSAVRGGVNVPLTAAIATTQTTLDVGYYQIDCDGRVVAESHADESYDILTLTVTGAQVGDSIYIDWSPAGTIRAATGTCEVAPDPAPACSGSPFDCPEEPPPGDTQTIDDSTMGCSAGGSGAGLGLVFGLGLLLRPGRPAWRLRLRSRPSSSRDPRRARSERTGES